MTHTQLAAAIIIALAALVAAFAITAFLDWANTNVERHVQAALGDPREPTTTEMLADEYWANWPHYWAADDAADDEYEDRLDRELRDGLMNWGKPA